MDELDLNETPAQQPEEPFKGDSSVTAEQTVQAQPVYAEAQPQAAAVATEEKPKWVKIVELVSLIAITAAGLLSALFMCLMSYKLVADVSGTYMLKDVAENINKLVDNLTKLMEAEEPPMAVLGGLLSSMLYNAYIMMGMVMGIVAGLILGIMLIIKVIKQFAMKKETTLEKTSITSVLFFFAISVIVLSLAMTYFRSSYEGESIKYGVSYGGATLAGLIICGILFATYFICKIAANYKMYLGDKKTLINGCFNLGWAVVAMVVLAVLSCAPVALSVSESGAKAGMGFGFNNLFTDALGEVLRLAETASDETILSLGKIYGLAAVGMVIQIWFIFQSGKSLHGAMRGTVSADKTVKLGSQIWRLVFAVLYLIISVVLAQELIKTDYEGCKAMLAAPIVILIFAVIGLVLAIVNKVLVKDKVEKQDI